MNKMMALVVALAAVAAFATADMADARRLGGGRSLGAQRQATPAAPTAPSAAPTPSTPLQATPGKPAAAPAAAPAASGASRWLGPLAGLAAGIGLAALLSHFGLSEGFASILLVALLIGGGIFLVRMLLARRTQPARPLSYAGMGTDTSRVEPTMRPAASTFEPVMGSLPGPAPATGSFPPGFDAAAFVEQAKLQFRKLQAAYDTGDRKALSEVMTPEMFAEVARELAERGPHTPTEVIRLDGEVLDVATEGAQYWISVRFTGLLREDGTVLPKEFTEIWNLTKPVDGSSGWLLAGIQQPHEMA